MQAEAFSAGDAGDHARRSLVRRIYLYLAMFASVIGGMASAGFLLFFIFNRVLGGAAVDFLQNLLKALEWLILFVLLGLYHGMILRRDGRMALQALADKHAAFSTLLLDPGDGTFAAGIQAAVQKQMPALPLAVHSASQALHAENLAGLKAVLLPADLALDPPEAWRDWLHGFKGARLVIPRASAGWIWVGAGRAEASQAAGLLRKLAEGQEMRQRTPSPGWMTVLYIIAGLFGVQVLFMLFSLVASSLFG
jgi:hypothetical protein